MTKITSINSRGTAENRSFSLTVEGLGVEVILYRICDSNNQ